jgi:hypothetical protein
MADDLGALDEDELRRRVEHVRERMRPLESGLASLRGERDLLMTELRRRERNTHRSSRADLKAAMKEGRFPTVGELVAGSDAGSLDEYVFNLKTGGEVRLGFPGSRSQSLSFTDGVKLAQAKDLSEAARLFAAGWELGSPGRPGVRIQFAVPRQARLVAPEEIFARHRDVPEGP